MSQPPTRKYPAACKERAVKFAVESEPFMAQTARDLGVQENTLHPGIGQDHRVARQAPQVNAAHRSEACKRLRKDKARLQAEGAIGKKAAASWAHQRPYSTPGSTSSTRSAAAGACASSWRARAGALMRAWGVPRASRGTRISRDGTKGSAMVRRGVARMVRVGARLAWRRQAYGSAAVAWDACSPQPVCAAQRGVDAKCPLPQGQPRPWRQSSASET
jgi:transposase